MTSFLTALNGFYSNVNSNDTVADCVSKIPTSDFHFYLLIPSILLTLLLSFTLRRKSRGLLCCWGRPGAVFPMDILGKSHRFSYAAAWGSIAFLATDMVFGSTAIVNLQGPSYITVFNKILSMIIIGIDYFPLFAALGLESVSGHVIGTSYSWMLLSIQIFREVECDLVVQTRIILVLRDLPNLLCLSYLSISIPVRAIRALKQKTIRLFDASEVVSVLDMSKDIHKTPEAIHVKSILRPPPLPLQTGEDESRFRKISAVVKKLVGELVYRRKQNFRYSARILSVMLIGTFVIYKVTLETIVLVISILKLTEDGFDIFFDEIGKEDQPDDDEYTPTLRAIAILVYYLIINGRICFLVAMSLACVTSALTILNMLSSYRSTLFELYRGDITHIPHRSTRSNSSLLIGSMTYAGYQVAYIAWGLVIHFIILFIVALAVCIVITLIQLGYYQWLLRLLANACINKFSRPALLMTIIVMITQTIVSKFAFLQEKGEFLALNNRRVLFSFTFFMFFYNIFVGFLSCLLRIIKSIGIGAAMLPRLDNSVLPRRFQMFDPGFANYCGFMHVEATHTHPVMLVFLRLLLLTNQTDDDDNKSSGPSDSTAIVSVDMNEKDKEMQMFGRSGSKARTRWFLFYTLQNNPSLRTHRKFHIRLMKQLRDRRANL
ncbi:receptor for retinol uptake stra6-like [Ruditapes philippinarum]|uniref:receptor for retinol uptake stra6-like n=1 Tax=Ruditapes philippinarum TaxID=129788 RepID=UPI00295BCC28|nr:receptor for retinol uptake stra6-like [Ruditapes philippinarum]